MPEISMNLEVKSDRLKSLLVVDDERNVAYTVSEILKREGYYVEMSLTGEGAVERLREKEFDLVLTDLHMETVDGISILTELQRHHPLTIALVLTGFASLESAVASMRQGAYDYLIKPCMIEDLKHTIRRGLEHRRLLVAEQEAKLRLEGLNAELERRVEEQTRQLRMANEELLRNSAAKDVFLATLSHELRTPLTPIVGWSRVLMANPTQAILEKGLKAIERNALHQARLIEDLLDVSRIITGKLTFNPEFIDVRQAVEVATDTMREKAMQKSIHLVSALPAEPVYVHGVQIRLEQIFWNLISNSIKFTESGGRVSIHVEDKDGEVYVTISDTGIGISAEFLPHVFERFKQAEWFERRKHDGLGLGLSIVEGLVELHRGRVSVESAGVGHGTTFTVVLPSAAITNTSAASLDETRADTHTVEPVMLIDDSRDTLEVLGVIINHAGWEVVTAQNVSEALAILKNVRPCMIITDIGLPDVDGFSMMANFRDALPARVPIVALSGFAEEDNRRRALQLGFADYITKPADPDRIIACVRRLTSRVSSATT
jgi:signal transduction histidine kinase